MQEIKSKEGKFLYLIYILCEQNTISITQKGYLKDLLIQGDEEILDLLKYLEKNLIDIEESVSKILDIITKISSDSYNLAIQSPKEKKLLFRSQHDYFLNLNIFQDNKRMRHSHHALDTQGSSRRQDSQ